jgi:LmbE family N-acetylglucosaminyl deacetylase
MLNKKNLKRRLTMKDRAVHILAFAPHPHDADGTIGGTVARKTREGKDVVFVICTNGDKGSMDPAMKPEKLAQIREEEQLASAKLLGVKEVIFLRHPDLCTEDTPEFRKELLRLILTYRPEIVATRDPYNTPYVSNRDHRIVGRAVLDAVWPYALSPNFYPDLQEEGLQLHKVQQVLLWSPQEPNYRCNIEDTIDIKLEAVRCHQSQIPDFEHEKKMILDMATRGAQGTEFKYAEAFVRVEIPQQL